MGRKLNKRGEALSKLKRGSIAWLLLNDQINPPDFIDDPEGYERWMAENTEDDGEPPEKFDDEPGDKRGA